MIKKLENRNIISEKRFKEDFANKLKHIREQSSLTRNQASKLIGVSNSTLQAWEENGNRTPNSWDLIKISRAYNISIHELFSSFENSFSYPEGLISDSAGHLVELADFSFIPHYNVPEKGDISEDNYTFSAVYQTLWIKKHLKTEPKNLIALTLHTDPMLDASNNHRIMLIDIHHQTLSDGIYILRLDQDLLVKHVQKLPHSVVRISSINQTYRSFDVNTSQSPLGFDVIGRVVFNDINTYSLH